MARSEQVDKSKIFIFGQVGEKLKAKDPDLLLSILEQDPNNHLYNSFRRKLRPLREKLKSSTNDAISASITRDDIKDEIDTAHIFREIGEFMRSGDMDELSTGSLVLGEVKNPEAEQSDIYDDDDDDEYMEDDT